MNWFKQSKEKAIEAKIKDILKKHPFTQYLCNYYKIPVSDIDNHLDIEISELDGQYAEGNGKKIRIDPKLFEKDFFKDNFHFVIHEFFHWIKRRSENDFYLNDPEEVQSFVLQITWQLINKKNKEEIKENIYPIIRTHYKNDLKAMDVYDNMLNEALNIYKYYLKNE